MIERLDHDMKVQWMILWLESDLNVKIFVFQLEKHQVKAWCLSWIHACYYEDDDDLKNGD